MLRDTHLACREWAEAGAPSVNQRTRAVAVCLGGKPGSSRRANSPAEAKVKEHTVTPVEQMDFPQCHNQLHLLKTNSD